MTTGRTGSPKKGGGKRARRPWLQLALRLAVLLGAAAVILAIGMAKKGWQPFGAKQGRLARTARETPTPQDSDATLDARIHSVVDRIRKNLSGKSGTATPTPSPSPSAPSDEEKLKDFLEKEMGKP